MVDRPYADTDRSRVVGVALGGVVRFKERVCRGRPFVHRLLEAGPAGRAMGRLSLVDRERFAAWGRGSARWRVVHVERRLPRRWLWAYSGRCISGRGTLVGSGHPVRRPARKVECAHQRVLYGRPVCRGRLGRRRAVRWARRRLLQRPGTGILGGRAVVAAARSQSVCANGGGSPGGSSLNGVSCTSPRACTAVGTGVYRWNGRRWSTQRAPIGADELGGVSCTSANACTAVGSGVYSWNGRRWLSVPITDASAADRELAGVSCLSRASCVAVGNYTDGGLEVRPLVESIGMGAKPPRQANATAEG